MKLRQLYLVFALLGFLFPYSQLIRWIVEHHALNMPLSSLVIFSRIGSAPSSQWT